jgi:hypothetical protein
MTLSTAGTLPTSPRCEMTAVAREAGVTGEGLYKALSEDGDPSLDDAAGRGAGVRPQALCLYFAGCGMTDVA